MKERVHPGVGEFLRRQLRKSKKLDKKKVFTRERGTERARYEKAQFRIQQATKRETVSLVVDEIIQRNRRKNAHRVQCQPDNIRLPQE